MVRAQVMNARTGVHIASGMKGIAMTMDAAAPREAPDERPRMYGDARGFLNTACIYAPQTARPAPTNIPITTRGALMSRMMISEPQVPWPSRASMISLKE